jgi:hypothetical protein
MDSSIDSDCDSKIDRLQLKSTGRSILTRIVKLRELNNSLPIKFKSRLCQAHLDGNEAAAIVARHSEIADQADEHETRDLVQCLLTDFPKELSQQEADDAPKLLSRSATHMKVTAIIAHSRQLDIHNFAKIAMGQIGQNLQARRCFEPACLTRYMFTLSAL